MYYVSITIIGLGKSFNFYLSEIHLFKNCGAHFCCDKGRFHKGLELMLFEIVVVNEEL